jgi:haloacetate dehalogenase
LTGGEAIGQTLLARHEIASLRAELFAGNAMAPPSLPSSRFASVGSSDFLHGFVLHDFETAGAVRIRFAIAGEGPPLLLLHGHPQTHVTWRKIAPALADRFTVVAADLRGYGDSSKPDGGADHINYSKRAMALDQVELMRALDYPRFCVVGHDRGGRVAHRMALDHPDAVARLALFDIAPTATMYARTDQAFATRYFWWFFLIQPYPLPEKLIAADPEFFLRRHIDGQNKIAGATEARAFAEYLRCYLDPATRHAVCEDYRAAAGIDLVHDKADHDKRVIAPLLALWGGRGTVGALYDVLQTWREKAVDVHGHALDCGHTLQEELPEAVITELFAFLSD